MKGLSRSNLFYMRSFAKAWPQIDQKSHTLVGLLPWGHIQVLLDKLDGQRRRDWYAASAVEFGWSRDVLLNHIKNRTLERTRTAPSNDCRPGILSWRSSSRRTRTSSTSSTSPRSGGAGLRTGTHRPHHPNPGRAGCRLRVRRPTGEFRSQRIRFLYRPSLLTRPPTPVRRRRVEKRTIRTVIHWPTRVLHRPRRRPTTRRGSPADGRDFELWRQKRSDRTLRAWPRRFTHGRGDLHA